jgi:hypothetical protein
MASISSSTATPSALSALPAPAALPELYDGVRAWLAEHRHQDNSMLTTQFLEAAEGIVQVKWWRREGRLLVYNLDLRTGGFREFTALCRGLMAAEPDVKEVRLVGFHETPEQFAATQELTHARALLKALQPPPPSPWARLRDRDAKKRATVTATVETLQRRLFAMPTLRQELTALGWEGVAQGEYRLPRAAERAAERDAGRVTKRAAL